MGVMAAPMVTMVQSKARNIGPTLTEIPSSGIGNKGVDEPIFWLVVFHVSSVVFTEGL